MNVLIIGLGSIAKKHVSALKSLQYDVNIYALRSNPEVTTEEGVINVFNIDYLPKSIDFTIISNPSHLHFQFIELFSKKGIPLFIEKPAVHSLVNVDSLLSRIEEQNIITYVACNLRFHPCLTFLKRSLDFEVQRINEVNVYCGSYLPDWRSGRDFRTIYSANASMGGGVHLDLFHELDYTTWLFGFPKKSNSILRSVSNLDIDSIDYANYVLEYDQFTASIILNYYRKKPKRQIEIIFEDGTWTVDLIKNEILTDSGDYLFKIPDYNVRNTYALQLDYFIECLKRKEQPMNSLKDSVKNLKICLNYEEFKR